MNDEIKPENHEVKDLKLSDTYEQDHKKKFLVVPISLLGAFIILITLLGKFIRQLLTKKRS